MCCLPATHSISCLTSVWDRKSLSHTGYWAAQAMAYSWRKDSFFCLHRRWGRSHFLHSGQGKDMGRGHKWTEMWLSRLLCVWSSPFLNSKKPCSVKVINWKNPQLLRFQIGSWRSGVPVQNWDFAKEIPLLWRGIPSISNEVTLLTTTTRCVGKGGLTLLQSSRKLGISLSVGWKLMRSECPSSSISRSPSTSSRETGAESSSINNQHNPASATPVPPTWCIHVALQKIGNVRSDFLG